LSDVGECSADEFEALAAFVVNNMVMILRVFCAIFSLAVAAAGWYYMFYSRAADKLGAVEDQAINQKRSRLRRIGGFAMFLLAVFLFAGSHSVDEKTSPLAFLVIWITVFILLFVIVVLALVDVRLTARLRRRRLNPPTGMRD